jgi:hypothetical protein
VSEAEQRHPLIDGRGFEGDGDVGVRLVGLDDPSGAQREPDALTHVNSGARRVAVYAVLTREQLSADVVGAGGNRLAPPQGAQ